MKPRQDVQRTTLCLDIEHAMKFSDDRILTTHTGSLPRPPDLVNLLNSRELGESYDRAAFSGRVRWAILEIVRHQADAGIDIVDDGEHSKINWMAYARARLSGLEEIDSPVSFRGPTRDSLAFPHAYEDMKVMLVARLRTSCRSEWCGRGLRSAPGQSRTLARMNSQAI